MNKILIFQLRPGIGDMCLFLSSIKEIYNQNKKSEIYIITKKRSSARNFLKDEKFIKKIFYIEDIKKNNLFTFFALVFFLIKFKFHTSYIFHYGIKYYFLSKILKIKNVYFYGIKKKNENISKKIYQSTCKWLNIKDYNTTPIIKCSDVAIKGNKILIGIGSSGITRRWQTDYFVNLIKKINTISKFHFYLLAGQNEKRQAYEIMSKITKINITSLCNLSIYNSFKYIKNSKIYVGTDSAFMHLSAALNVKSFGLFGDTPVNYSDYSKNIFPIIPENFTTISHQSNAMKLIKPDFVFKIIKQQLL
jgi:heptosyltransferase-2